MIKFNKEVMKRFNQIPDEIKSKLLSNVYCSKCGDIVIIIDFEATMDKGDLILKGKCKNCSGNVARLIEG